MPETFNDSSMVRLHNVGATTFRKEYAGLWYEIAPDGQRGVPYNAACMWLGNPHARNVPGGKDQDQHRRNECRRLSTYYGIYGDPWYLDPEDPERDVTDPENARPYLNLRHSNLPNLEMYSFENDERIYTVVDDPEGDRISPASGTRLEARAHADQLRILQKNQEEILSALRKVDPRLAAELTSSMAVPTQPASILLPDDDQSIDIVDDGFDEKPVEEVEAVEDVPPTQRPAARKPAKVT